MRDTLASPRWGNVLLVTFFGLTMLDWMFTVYFLGHGATEMNPLLAPLIDDSPFSVLLVKLAVCAPAVLLFSAQWFRPWVRNVVIGLTTLYAVLIVYELVLCALYV